LSAALIAGALAVAGCSSDGEAIPADGPVTTRAGGDQGGGWNPFGGGDGERKRREEQSIGVNSLLWRATLDTISFMPLTLTDSFGGVILTDWYADPRTPNERFKMQVYILDTRLRADGIKVNVFKQVQGPNGWADAAVSDDTAIQIENAILARARELRLATLNDN
jgi:hypothetical protein